MSIETRHHRGFAAGAIVLLALVCLAPDHALANDPCYGLTYEGNCDGDIAQWCENNEVIQVDCSDQGMVCAWNDEKNYYGCESESCDLPDEGFCQSTSTVSWCHDNGETLSLECGEGTMCGWNEEEAYFDCIPEEESMGVGGARIDSFEEDEETAEPQNAHASNHEDCLLYTSDAADE